MKCSNCNSETNRTSIYFLEDGRKIEQCTFCPEKYQPRQIYKTDGIYVRGGRDHLRSVGKRTAAHDADISRRRLSPDGKEVYREVGRRTFQV